MWRTQVAVAAMLSIVGSIRGAELHPVTDLGTLGGKGLIIRAKWQVILQK